MSGDVEGRMMIYEMLKLQPIPKYNFEFKKQYFIKILHGIKSGPKMDLLVMLVITIGPFWVHFVPHLLKMSFQFHFGQEQ